jgi:hypothetical protein
VVLAKTQRLAGEEAMAARLFDTMFVGRGDNLRKESLSENTRGKAKWNKWHSCWELTSSPLLSLVFYLSGALCRRWLLYPTGEVAVAGQGRILSGAGDGRVQDWKEWLVWIDPLTYIMYCLGTVFL